jgi:hypothetical protein
MMRWHGAFAFAVVLVATPAAAADVRVPEPPLAVYPKLVTSFEGDYLTGQFDTGNPSSAHQFDSRAYNVSLGVRLNEHLLISARYQEAWTNANLSLVPQSLRVHSQSWGLRALVNVAPVVWDTTVSAGIDNNSTAISDPFGFFPPLNAFWHGREWAVDSSVSARLPLGFLILEPLAGVRVVKLHDEGFTTDGFIPLTVPAQSRSDTSWRGQGTVSAPIRLDESGTLTPWASGEIRRSNNPHPALGVLTDLTGMAGGHYVFNLPFLESPVPFPAQTWKTASAGLRLDVSPSYFMAATTVWSFNDRGSWWGYRVNATVKF